MALTDEDVARILKIIDDSNYDEVHIEVDDLKLHLRRNATADAPPHDSWTRTSEVTPAARDRPDAAKAAAPSQAEKRSVADEPVPEGLVTIRAPMVGTFYRAPSPGEKPFVEVGDKVDPDSTVCLVEVMKLFHSVKAGVAGTVKQIRAENGSMVEHGQVLLLLERGVWRT